MNNLEGVDEMIKDTEIAMRASNGYVLEGYVGKLEGLKEIKERWGK